MDIKGFKLPSSPGMPLFPLSPERVNGVRAGPPSPTHSAVPSSPILGPHSPSKHIRNSSDVQGMVARFNSLDIKDHVELRAKDAAALRRAQLGREEAEQEARRGRDETRALRREIETAKERENAVAQRLEVVMEELQRAKETQGVAQGLYEKEIRRARKEAFKAASAVVKLQEELKSARKEVVSLRADVDFERVKVARREQDTFTAQYQLVGVQEELAQEKEKLGVLKEERDALKTSLKEEEVARIAAEGRIALPAETRDDDEFASPKKKRPSLADFDKENAPPSLSLKSSSEMEKLREDIERQTRRCQAAEEQVEYMKMECQFRCCSCRVADQQGDIFIHDRTFEDDMLNIKRTMAEFVTFSADVPVEPAAEDIMMEPNLSETIPQNLPTPAPSRSNTPTVMQHNSSPVFDSSHEPAPIPKRQNNQNDSMTVTNDVSPNPTPPAQANVPRHPSTPAVHTITTTTTIPLAPENDYSTIFTPSGLTREAAIELLRERRGRARSFAQTPKKTPSGRSVPRRDMSAPEMREGNEKETAGKTPRSLSRSKALLR